MAARNLTRAAVEAFAYNPLGASRQVLWDGKVRGFGVRATPAGGKQYVLSYRFNGRPRLMSLGPLDHFRSLDEAREKASGLLHDLRKDGIDPLSSRERLANAATIGELWATYAAEHLSKLSRNTRLNVLGSDPAVAGGWWGNHIAPEIKHLKPLQVTSADIIRLHDKVSRTAGPVTANRCVQRLHHFFDWATDRDERLFPAEWRNPTVKVRLHKELPRSNFLSPDQMRTLVAALDAHPDPYFRGFVGLLLFTAARKNEVLKLKWQDVDLVQRVARVEHTKNGTSLAMPLPDVAVRLLETIPRAVNNDHVFPAQQKRGAAMSEPRLRYKALLKQLQLPVETTFHDLRRSVGCSLAALGYSDTIIAGLLNNTSRMAARHYIKLAGETTRKVADAHAAVLLPAAKTLPSNAAQSEPRCTVCDHVEAIHKLGKSTHEFTPATVLLPAPSNEDLHKAIYAKAIRQENAA